MNPPKEPFYGRTVDLPMRLSERAAVRIAFMIFFPVFLIGLPLMSKPDPRLNIVFVLGLIMIPVCAWGAFSFYRAATWVNPRFKLTRKTLTIPLYPLYKQQSRTFQLTELLPISLGMLGDLRTIKFSDRHGDYHVPHAWFPEDWELNYVLWRTHLRWDLRRDGNTVDAVKLAALEAKLDHVGENGEPAIAVAVFQGEAGPRVQFVLTADGEQHLRDGTKRSLLIEPDSTEDAP